MLYKNIVETDMFYSKYNKIYINKKAKYILIIYFLFKFVSKFVSLSKYYINRYI